MGSSIKSDFWKLRLISKNLHVYGIQWACCNSENSLTRKFILLLNIFRIIQAFSSGDPEAPDPAALSPTPHTGTPRSWYWAQVMLLSLEPGWICLKLRKPTDFFDTLNLVQRVFSNQIHGTSRQDRAWKGSALLYCEDRQSKSTFISIVSIEIQQGGITLLVLGRFYSLRSFPF